jgi:GntR family transcriptional regulator/MocR family aminotransferase
MYLEIDRSSRNPIRNQLYEQLLKKILSGEMVPGSQMPSSRYLHEKLNISRNLILEVYEQLSAEGYLEGRHGKGTWVSQNMVLGSYVEKQNRYGSSVPRREERGDLIRFTCGIPDLEKFPTTKWKHSINHAWSLSDVMLYSYPSVRGREELRSEIADYLIKTKGICANPDCIIITSGTAESLQLLASHFSSSTKDIIIEDPVVDFASTIFAQFGYRLYRVPVNEQGLDCSQLPVRSAAKLIFVSPSHQFPLGVTLPAERRVALVDYAASRGMYIIEDDYDSEFRYAGHPLRSLCIINPEAVIHAGTFSKNMIPSLRLGYLVVPESLFDGLIDTKRRLMMRTQTEAQIAMAHFMRNGTFVRHIAAMKRIYRGKYFTIMNCLRTAFGDSIHMNDNAAGLHLHITHRSHQFSAEECRIFSEYGVMLDCEADYSSTRKPGGLLLGFGNVPEAKIDDGIQRLKKGINAIIKGSTQ